MSTKTKVTRIDRQVCKGRQDVILKEILKYGDLKLKVEIKSDSYRFQCYARISILDTQERKWNILHSIHYSNMQTPEKLVYSREEGQWLAAKFSGDRNKLIKMAQELI